MPTVNYNLPEPARAQYVIAAPVTTDINVIAPTGYTVVGSASKTLKAGLKVTIMLDGTNYVVTEGYFEIPPATNVLGTVLTGLSLLTATAITAADTVLSAFGKLQGQITALIASLTDTDNKWNPKYYYYLYTDYEGAANSAATMNSDRQGFAAQFTGAIAAQAGELNAVGLLRLTTGINAAGLALQAGAGAIVVGAGVTTVEHRVRLNNLSDATDRYSARIGMMNNFGDATNAIFFRYADNVNIGKWQIVTRSATVETATDSGVLANTNFNKFTIVINAAGNSVEFFINEVSVGTITTNIPSAAVGIGFQIWKSVGTTARTLDADYTMAMIKFTTPR